MARYGIRDNQDGKAFELTLSVPYEEVAEYIGDYGYVYGTDDTMGDEFAVARMAVAFGTFRALAENDLHAELKHFCQNEVDWSAIHPDDGDIATPYAGAPTPQELLDEVLRALGNGE